MGLNIIAYSETNNDLLNDELLLNRLNKNINQSQISHWLKVLEYCIDEQIIGKWQRIIPIEKVIEFSEKSKAILSKTHIDFIMVIDHLKNEYAVYNDIKKMSLFLNICVKHNARLQFI
jgi:hypothetical protein